MSSSPTGVSWRSSGRSRTASLLRLVGVIASLLAALSVTSAIGVATAGTVAPRTATVEQLPAVTSAPPLATGPAPPATTVVRGLTASQSTSGVSPPAQTPVDPSCRLSTSHLPQGTTSPVATDYEAPPAATVLRVRIEIEDGIAIDPECFVDTVGSILNDPRGWGNAGQLAFQPVTGDDIDFRLVLASPGTTDSLCYPLRTGSKYSCRNRETVVLNLARWELGTAEYVDHLDIYRQYLVNHEVGHLLGHGHRQCPGDAQPAPVMMQQTKGLGECSLNGWPTRDER